MKDTCRVKKIERGIAVIANICAIIGLLISSYCVHSISMIKVNTTQTGDGNTAINENNNYYRTTQSLSKDKAIELAQQLFKQEKYESAYDLFIDWKNEEISSLYLGYMYSNGIVVQENFEEACKCYKQSADAGNRIALENYIYINLYKPQNYNSTIEALKYGYDKNCNGVMIFLHAIMTESKNAELSVADQQLQETARQFMKLLSGAQQEKLFKFLIISSEEIVGFVSDANPQNKDFEKYIQIANSYTPKYKDIDKYVNIYAEKDNELYIDAIVPVYIQKKYYIKSKQKFLYAEQLFAESLPEI